MLPELPTIACDCCSLITQILNTCLTSTTNRKSTHPTIRRSILALPFETAMTKSHKLILTYACTCLELCLQQQS
jgi:hypothetical protein